MSTPHDFSKHINSRMSYIYSYDIYGLYDNSYHRRRQYKNRLARQLGFTNYSYARPLILSYWEAS